MPFLLSFLSVLKSLFEIIVLWVVFYRILVFFEGTRAFQVLKGITYLLIAFLISQVFGLDTLNWLLTKLFGISILALLIIFQPELRQGLARLGQQHLFNLDIAEAELLEMIESLAHCAFKLAQQKNGHLIAIEREIKLKIYIESGLELDSKFSGELLQSIFAPESPLHDGGVIIRGGRMVAASCLFPLSENPNFSKVIGTRHRAGLGLSEQTDAIIIVGSEETGEVSLALDGQFIPVNNEEKMANTLKDLLLQKKIKKNEKVSVDR